ncbi:hypothetical protein BJY00DRAFT_308113 [Aspergillus carlsbadensis]|nr:hypothetical protein BJY00DRAFT_308113 [Aspergillus carlsbadensis]
MAPNGKGKAKAAATGNQGPPRRSGRASRPPERLGAAAPNQNTNDATAGKRGRGRPKKGQEKAQGRKRRRAVSSDDEGDDQEDDEDGNGRPAKRRQKGALVAIYVNDSKKSSGRGRGKGDAVLHWITKRRWPKGMSRGNQRPRGGGAAISSDDYNGRDDGDDDNDDDEDKGGAGGRNSQSSSRSKWTNFLQAQGSYGYEGWNGLHQEDTDLLAALAARDCATPQGTVFDANTLRYLDRTKQSGTHTGLAALVFPLIVPFAGVEALRGAVPVNHLLDMIGQTWDACPPLDLYTQRFWQIPEPRPYYTAGFSRRIALSDALSTLLEPYLSTDAHTSTFQASSDIIFPFLTAEGKDCYGSIKEADKENLHHMTRAMKGVVELFKAVKREKELDCRILGFSISFDYEMVKIHAHYPVITEKDDATKVDYHRHEINSFSFTTQNGKDRWTCYKFVMAIYNDWVPKHFERLCSAIDQLPAFNLSVDAEGSGSGDSADTAAVASGALGSASPSGAAGPSGAAATGN